MTQGERVKEIRKALGLTLEMFEDLPETILDELCIEYDLDDDDRDILNFYLGLPVDARDAIKKQIKKIFVKE